jgi:signal peptide peptidase SppA
MTSFPHLAQRLFNVPLAIRPEKAEVIVAALAERLGIVALNGRHAMRMAVLDENDFGTPRARIGNDRPYDLVAGVAVIPVTGTLVQKLGTLRPYSGMTGYDGIRANLLTALDDPEAAAIVLDIDSPGGEVPGCFDLADAVYAARGQKPIWALLDEMACSAAYALASACERVTVPRTGISGSIGVVTMHVDFSKALEKEGIAVSFIHYGARKIDGTDALPLSKEARERIQRDIDATGDLFVATVARNRKLQAKAVRDQEADTFQGAAGIAAGLVDAVMAPDEAFAELVQKLSPTA